MKKQRKCSCIQSSHLKFCWDVKSHILFYFNASTQFLSCSSLSIKWALCNKLTCIQPLYSSLKTYLKGILTIGPLGGWLVQSLLRLQLLSIHMKWFVNKVELNLPGPLHLSGQYAAQSIPIPFLPLFQRYLTRMHAWCLYRGTVWCLHSGTFLSCPRSSAVGPRDRRGRKRKPVYAGLTGYTRNRVLVSWWAGDLSPAHCLLSSSQAMIVQPSLYSHCPQPCLDTSTILLTNAEQQTAKMIQKLFPWETASGNSDK